MVRVGTMFGATGICGVETITTISIMVGLDGSGADIGELACTCTACAHSTGIIKDIGAECVPTGICIGEITTTRDLVGSGDDTARLDVTCIDCAS